MAIAPPPIAEQPTKANEKAALKVSSYEQAATLVITLLVIFGTSFGALAMIFFADKFNREEVVAIEFVPMEATSPTGNGGFGTDPEPPGTEEGSELAEPSLAETLEAVETTTELLSDAVMSDSIVPEQAAAQGAAEQASKGSGVGDARQPGPGNDGVIERVPRWERWKIRFEPESAADFAKWLDQYKIRIGVLGRDNQVHLAYDFASGAAKTESAKPIEYGSWGQTLPADGPMPALTKDLARKAGILQRGPIALLFYPMDVERLLYTLEKAQNKFDDANKIRETVFTVIQDGSGYRFEVVDQKYF
jgi:hypothetical protein